MVFCFTYGIKKILLYYFYLLSNITVHRKCYLKYLMTVSVIILNTNYPYNP